MTDKRSIAIICFVVALLGGGSLLYWGMPQWTVIKEAAYTCAFLLALVASIVAMTALIMGCYCFVEESISIHFAWTVGILLPPLAGLGIGYLCFWLSMLFDVSFLRLLGLILGIVIALVSPAVCLILTMLQWKRFAGYFLAVFGSVGYLILFPLTVWLFAPWD